MSNCQTSERCLLFSGTQHTHQDKTNEKGQRKWLEKMLTVEDIQGKATMILENEQLVIPHAFVSSDKVDAGAKGILSAERADGIFYARFRKLDAILKIMLIVRL